MRILRLSPLALLMTMPVWGSPVYTATKLGANLPSGSIFNAAAINNSGQIAGTVQSSPGHFEAFLYSAGTLTALGTQGSPSSGAYGINDNGQVAFTSWFFQDHPVEAFLYGGGLVTPLGTLGGATSVATGVNNSGQVAG